MRKPEPFIRIGDEGEVTERGGWEPKVNDTPDSGTSNQDNTPMPDLLEHDFEADRRRNDISSILDIDPNWLPN